MNELQKGVSYIFQLQTWIAVRFGEKDPLPKPLHFFLGFALKQLKHTIFIFHAFVLDHLFPYQMVRNKKLQQGQGGSHQPDR